MAVRCTKTELIDALTKLAHTWCDRCDAAIRVLMEGNLDAARRYNGWDVEEARLEVMRRMVKELVDLL